MRAPSFRQHFIRLERLNGLCDGETMTSLVIFETVSWLLSEASRQFAEYDALV